MGDEAEAVSFCQEWDRDTIVEVNVYGLEIEPDPDVREAAFGCALDYEPTDYYSAFRVLGSIGRERILDAWPSYLGTPAQRYGDDGGS